MTYNGWYAIKPNQPTINRYTHIWMNVQTLTEILTSPGSNYPIHTNIPNIHLLTEVSHEMIYK